MTHDTLFDPRRVPPGVISPEVIADAEAVVTRLRARLVPRVEIADPQSPAGVAAMIRAHDQVFIRRALHLAEAGARAAMGGRGLATLTLARRIFEVVGSYHHLAGRLETLLDRHDSGEVADYVFRTAFETHLRDHVEPADGDASRALALLALIDEMTAERPGIREEYDHLCEHEYPNVFGSWLYYADYDQQAGVVRFLEREHGDPDYFQWMVRAIRLLGFLEEIVGRVEARLPAA